MKTADASSRKMRRQADSRPVGVKAAKESQRQEASAESLKQLTTVVSSYFAGASFSAETVFIRYTALLI